jgi:hypothetical protein
MIKQMEMPLWSEVKMEPGQTTTLMLWPGSVWRLNGSFSIEPVSSNTVRLTMLEGIGGNEPAIVTGNGVRK